MKEVIIFSMVLSQVFQVTYGLISGLEHQNRKQETLVGTHTKNKELLPLIDSKYIEQDYVTCYGCNPGRRAELLYLSRAIGNYEQDTGELLPLTSEYQHISKNELDICANISPEYMYQFPSDNRILNPGQNNEYFQEVRNCNLDYATGYFAKRNGNSIYTIAPLAEYGELIEVEYDKTSEK